MILKGLLSFYMLVITYEELAQTPVEHLAVLLNIHAYSIIYARCAKNFWSRIFSLNEEFHGACHVHVKFSYKCNRAKIVPWCSNILFKTL